MRTTGASLQKANLSRANLDDADLSNVTVGSSSYFAPGQLPTDFPKGWDAPPDGWKLFEEGGRVRLRRVNAPSAAPSSPLQ